MTIETFKEALFKISSKGNLFERIYFTGFGEPSTLKTMPEFVSMARPWYTVLTTNGTCSPELMPVLRDAGLQELIFSVNYHTREQARDIMGVDIITTTAAITAAVRAGLHTSSITIISKLTQPKLPQIRAWVKSLGVTDTYFCPCHTRGSSFIDTSIHEEIAVTRECSLIGQTLYIAWNGNIPACPDDIAGESNLGNILVDSMDQILQRKSECRPEFKMCKSCDDLFREASREQIRRVLLLNGVQPEWLTWP
jgi:hypothetical protein